MIGVQHDQDDNNMEKNNEDDNKFRNPKISYIYHMRLVLFTLALLTCFLAVVAKPYSPITVP